jgi:hypothetical protein
MQGYHRQDHNNMDMLYLKIIRYNTTVLTCDMTHYNIESVLQLAGLAVAQLVEALRYEPEGRGFHSR